MGHYRLLLRNSLGPLNVVIGAMLATFSINAQEVMGGGMSFPICGAMGWGGMVLSGVLIISFIAALVALAVFLIRKSRSPQAGH